MTTMYQYMQQALAAGISEFKVVAKSNDTHGSIEFSIVPVDDSQRGVFAQYSIDKAGNFFQTVWSGCFAPGVKGLGKPQPEEGVPTLLEPEDTTPETAIWDAEPIGTLETMADGPITSKAPSLDFSEPAPPTDDHL